MSQIIQRRGDPYRKDLCDEVRDYARNACHRTGSITYEYEVYGFDYDRAIRLFAGVMDVEEVATKLYRLYG